MFVLKKVVSSIIIFNNREMKLMLTKHNYWKGTVV